MNSLQQIKKRVILTIEEINVNYDPELSLEANGFDSLDALSLGIEVEASLKDAGFDVVLGVNDFSLDMTLDYIMKIIEQKL